MNPIRRILVPTDFSVPAELAARKGVTKPGTNPNAGYAPDGK